MPRDVDAYNSWLPRFFPSTEPEPESDWEEVEAGESAENGPPVRDIKATDQKPEEPNTVTLPDVPTTEPAGEGPASKKLKPADEDSL